MNPSPTPWRFFSLVLGLPWFAAALFLPTAGGWFFLGMSATATLVVAMMWSVDL